MVFRKLMKATRSNPAAALTAITMVVGSFFLAAGCSRSDAAQSRESTAGAAEVSKSKADADSYTVEIKAAGPYKAGKEGTVEVTLNSKGAYHVNDKYPHKFKPTDPAPEGMKYPKALLKKEDGTFKEKSGVFKVPFIAAKAGKAKVSGTFSFSVCSDANCVMEKLDLDVDVDVK